jgi:hypothetical protein
MLANRRLKTLAEYTAAVALCLIIVTCVMKLWRADPRTAFEYGGDALFHGTVIKGIIDNGWYLQNNLTGMPGGSEMFYFPMADNLHFLLIKLFSFFTSDYALIFNFYFLLTFPLTTISSLYVFRHFKISYLIALLGSLLYTFLPYHFFRNQHHLPLAGYYIVPLMVMVVLWALSGRLLTNHDESNKGGLRLNLLSKRFIASVVICLLTASGGHGYYAFFACFFLLIAGVPAAFFRKSARHLIISLLLVAVVFGGLVINLLPNMIYIRSHGKSTTVERGTGEAESYGLKITQLLLPIDGHRIAALAQLKEKYNSAAPLVNENRNATLGVVGSVGFLVLLGWLLFWKPAAGQMPADDEPSTLLSHLSLLNISGVLLATIGGFASLFALLISPQLRCYNRVSIYLGFFSLFAVMLLLENLRRRTNFGRRPIIFQASLGLILLLGILDQTGPGVYFVPHYAAFISESASDADFVKRIEATVPPGVMIFQLPYVPFPENPPVNQMQDYEHFRPYLHSKNLRWSYGAIKERKTATWQMATANLPADQFLEAISLAGFSGVYVDRKGYTDYGADLETKLRSLLTIEPLISTNKQMSFFDLGAYNSKLAAKYGGALPSQRQLALSPLTPEWTTGCSTLEGEAELNWRWCSSAGELVINNPLDQERRVRLEMGLATGYEEPANLTLSGDLISEQVKINMNPAAYSKMLTLPPGRHVIRFACDAKLLYAPTDGRSLVFKVMNFNLQEMR